jgi:hypothetical protein
MRFIKGRYHVNPIMGDALEAAREAEAAFLALHHHDTPEDDSATDPDFEEAGAAGPIHQIHIEAAEVVPTGGRDASGRRQSEPAKSGHASRGFVVRLHRTPTSPMRTISPRSGEMGNTEEPVASSPAGASRPSETHVFSDHRDLISFLRDELAKHSGE